MVLALLTACTSDGEDASPQPTTAAVETEVSGASETSATIAPSDPSEADLTAAVAQVEVSSVGAGSTSMTSLPLLLGGERLSAEQVAVLQTLADDLLMRIAPPPPPQPDGASSTTAGFRSTAAVRGSPGSAPVGGASLARLGAGVVTIGDSLTTVGGGTPAQATSSATQSGAGGTGSISGSLGASSDAAGNRSAELSMELKVETDDGATASVKVRGRVTGPACPDAAGRLEFQVEGEVNVQGNTGQGASQSRHVFRGTVVLVFGDDGEVATFDTELDVESNDTRPSGRRSYLETGGGVSWSDPYRGGSGTAKDTVIVRRSQDVKLDRADVDMVMQGRELASSFVKGAADARRAAVQDGACVVVEVTGPTSVGAGAQVTPRVTVRHKLEGVELDTRADATLSGAGTLSTTSLASTPGELQYTAGAQQGDKGTITVVSRSRRGIGTGSITIEVRPSYRIQASDTGVLSMTGVVCSLDEPFTVTVSGGGLDGSITFSAPRPGSGTYAGSGTILTWSGGFTATGLDSESPVIRADDGTTTAQGGIAVPSFWEGGFTLTLVPDGSACS